MGSSSSKTVPVLESSLNQYLKIERILAAQCDFLPPNRFEDTIRVGIVGNSNPENPLGSQAIRIGDSDAYRLQSFQGTDESLVYNFEKNITLTLMKRRDSFVYHLKTPELDVTKEIYPGIVKMFKPIGMASDELDKIGTLFQMK